MSIRRYIRVEENTIWKDMVQEDIEEDKNIDKKDRIKKIKMP